MSEPKRQFRDFKEYHLEKLRDPQEAHVYLDIALEEYEKDKDKEAFLLALRDVAEAQGAIGKLAQETHLNHQDLYMVLSAESNLRLETVGAILHGLGFRLSVRPIEAQAKMPA